MIFSPLYSDRLGNFEDKINIVTFTKKDRYVSIGTDSLWYALDYLEFNVRPVIMNISKSQIEFIVDFFFQDPSLPDQEEQLKVIMPGKGKEPRKSKDENVQVEEINNNNTNRNSSRSLLYLTNINFNHNNIIIFNAKTKEEFKLKNSSFFIDFFYK